MMMRKEKFPVSSIINPNKAWVSMEIDKLIAEWQGWNEHCQKLKESAECDPNTCTESIKDGRSNLRKHDILREKTLVFLRNHFSGAELVLNEWPDLHHEDDTSQLRRRVPVWLQRLEILRASMDYVRTPDGFWTERGKELNSSLSRSTAEGAIDVVPLYLQNPLCDTASNEG